MTHQLEHLRLDVVPGSASVTAADGLQMKATKHPRRKPSMLSSHNGQPPPVSNLPHLDSKIAVGRLLSSIRPPCVLFWGYY